MHKRLFISNLPKSVDEADLRALFSQYGEINSVSISTSGPGGSDESIAFVEMASDVAARGILENLDGYKFEGRKLRIDEAPERARAGGRSFGSRR